MVHIAIHGPMPEALHFVVRKIQIGKELIVCLPWSVGLGHFKAGTVSNDMISHLDWMPTSSLAAQEFLMLKKNY
jgi:hypothetical protein